jgi:hypothetical protein
MSELRTVKDLAVGDVIQVQGFDDNLRVRSAKKIKKGLDAGKLQVTLVTPDGETEVMGFDPEERVKVVGRDAEAGKGQSDGKSRTRRKGKAKGKAKAKTEQKAHTGTAPPAESTKKLSALDAAAKVLAEAHTPMNCQELIQAIADKGLWVSPGGKTPSATLYSGILRELQTKGNEARFKKTERGKFVASNSKQ